MELSTSNGPSLIWNSFTNFMSNGFNPPTLCCFLNALSELDVVSQGEAHVVFLGVFQ